MKKFISTIQNLSERAAQLQAAMQSAPPKFAELREAVALSTGQLQQLRSEVQVSIADLKADNELQLIDSLREINSSVLVFQQAGYELGGVDMELSPVQRLLVHLNRMDDVSASRLHSLLNSNQHRKVTHALLKSLIQAEEMAEQVDLENLVYYKLIVNVGPIPAVRLCWRQECVEVAGNEPPMVRTGAELEPATAGALSGFGEGSFFERRTSMQPGTKSAVASVAEPAREAADTAQLPNVAPATGVLPIASRSPVEPARSLSGGKDWGKSSLERFKRMPSVSKYRR